MCACLARVLCGEKKKIIHFFFDTCVYHNFIGKLHCLHLLSIMGATILAECTSKTWKNLKNLFWFTKISITKITL